MSLLASCLASQEIEKLIFSDLGRYLVCFAQDYLGRGTDLASGPFHGSVFFCGGGGTKKNGKTIPVLQNMPE